MGTQLREDGGTMGRGSAVPRARPVLWSHVVHTCKSYSDVGLTVGMGCDAAFLL